MPDERENLHPKTLEDASATGGGETLELLRYLKKSTVVFFM